MDGVGSGGQQGVAVGFRGAAAVASRWEQNQLTLGHVPGRDFGYKVQRQPEWHPEPYV